MNEPRVSGQGEDSLMTSCDRMTAKTTSLLVLQGQRTQELVTEAGGPPLGL